MSKAVEGDGGEDRRLGARVASVGGMERLYAFGTEGAALQPLPTWALVTDTVVCVIAYAAVTIVQESGNTTPP